jgi:hypothetical protein
MPQGINDDNRHHDQAWLVNEKSTTNARMMWRALFPTRRSICPHALNLGYPLRALVEIRKCTIEVWAPPVELTRAGSNERDFILQPEHGPFPPIFADSNLVHVVSAIDLDYRLARHSMALKVRQRHFGEALRLRVGR